MARVTTRTATPSTADGKCGGVCSLSFSALPCMRRGVETRGRSRRLWGAAALALVVVFIVLWSREIPGSTSHEDSKLLEVLSTQAHK